MAEESKSWWQTLPGILTAVAGIITAVTGFLLAANQSGCFHKETNTTLVQQPADSTINKGETPMASATTLPAKTDTAAHEADRSAAGNTTTATNAAPEESTDDINLLSPDNGGNIVAASSDKWNQTIDGSEDWVQLDYGIGQQAVYGFKDGRTATFHSFAMLISEAADYNIKDFELLAGNDSPTGKFKSLGKFQTVNMKLSATPYQVFSFDTVTAKYVKFKLISDVGWVHPAAHEFQLWGKLD